MTELPYTSLKQLVEAVDGNEEFVLRAMLDNDTVDFYGLNDEHLLSLHPYEVQMQALALLGIEAEPV